MSCRVGSLSFPSVSVSMRSTIDGDWVQVGVEPVEKVSILQRKKNITPFVRRGRRLFQRCSFIRAPTVMLTTPSPSPIQHHSPATDLLLGHSESVPPRPLTRALRFSTTNDFFQKPSKPLDSWSASIPRTRAFSMASNARSSSKGKEPDVFDPLESGSFGEFSPFPHLV